MRGIPNSQKRTKVLVSLEQHIPIGAIFLKATCYFNCSLVSHMANSNSTGAAIIFFGIIFFVLLIKKIDEFGPILLFESNIC